MKKHWRNSLYGILLLALIGFPLLLVSSRYAYLLRIAGVAGLYMLLALGLNLVIGFVGLLDLGFMAFYAIGAYTAALLSMQGWPFWAATLAAMFVAALVRVLIGFPALRLRGDYLAMVTLGFGEVVRLILNNWDGLTNGPKGLPPVGRTIQNASLFGFRL